MSGYLAHHCAIKHSWPQEVAEAVIKLVNKGYEPMRAMSLSRFVHDRAQNLNKITEARYRQAAFRCLIRLSTEPGKHDMTWKNGYGVPYDTYILYDDKVCVRFHYEPTTQEVVTDFIGFFEDAKRRRR